MRDQYLKSRYWSRMMILVFNGFNWRYNLNLMINKQL